MNTKSVRHVLSVSDLSVTEILSVLSMAALIKQRITVTNTFPPLLSQRTMAMIFEKPSLRTRVSFETGMTYLGGHAIYLGPQDIGLGTRESIPDIAGTLSRYVSIIMARVFAHKTLEDLAAASSVPVINALSDREHPCQTLADLLTMKEQCGSLRGLTVAFVGDGENNVTHSLALAACKLGMHLRIASPKEYQPLPDIIEEAQKLAVLSGGSVILTKDPVEAVKGAKVVYTDTWVSMGDEKEKAKRLKDFRTYQINAAIMKKALPDAIFLHDMPAYRGNEVSAEVIDGKQSRIFDQAENRLHAQMALVILLLGARMP